MTCLSHLFHSHSVLDVLASQVRDALSGAVVDAVHEEVIGKLPDRLPVVRVSENGLEKITQLQKWMRQRVFSAWGIQTGLVVL